MIAGVISSYQEGGLLMGAVSSLLPAVDTVVVVEGPVAGAGDPSHVAEELMDVYPQVNWFSGATYKDDADKRNFGFRFAKRLKADWLLWLDGDEVLLWPEYFRDWAAAADYRTGIGGFPMRVVELDGSVALSNNRVVKVSAVRKFITGASTVELHTGMVVQLPNEKLCGAGGIPWGNMPTFDNGQPATPGSTELELFLARHRPPVHGEPHVLHRSLLRDPARQVQRQHEAEADRFKELLP